MEGIKAFHREASAYFVKIDGELSETFDKEVGMRQGCVMSP